MVAAGAPAAASGMGSSTTQQVKLVVNGRPITADAQSGSLLEFLRQQGFKSVKHACGEGGCGACAVLLTPGDGAEAAAAGGNGCCGGGGGARSVNSCLLPVYAADGCQVTTAEGLPKNADGVNPVADRLAGFFGSQCGFCTPGMAVACHAALAKAASQGKAPSAHDMRNGLDGNLCRCTGYRPIVDACKSFACDVDMEDLGFNMFTHTGEPLPAPALTAAPAMPDQHQQQQQQQQEEDAETSVPPLKVYQVDGGRQLVYVPHNMEQLMQVVLQQHEESGDGAGRQQQQLRVVAGHTGPGVYKDWPLMEPALLYIKQVRELQGVQVVMVEEGGQAVVRVGAAAPLADVINTLSSWSEGGKITAATKTSAAGDIRTTIGDAAAGVPAVWREMAAHLQRVAGSHVRSSATLVGNLVLCRSNGLPSDVATLLLAAGASVEVVQLQASSAPTTPATPTTTTLCLRAYLAQQQASSADAADAAAAAGAAAVLIGNGVNGQASSAAGSVDGSFQLVTAALIPVPKEGSRFWSSRIAPRWANAASTLNAAALWPAAGGSSNTTTPSFVLGMNLSHDHGPEHWRVAHCAAVEQALQQACHTASVTAATSETVTDGAHAAAPAGDSVSAGGCRLTAQVVSAALSALSHDLEQLFGLAPVSLETANGEASPQQKHAAYLRSASEGLLLQALAALLSDTAGTTTETTGTATAIDIHHSSAVDQASNSSSNGNGTHATAADADGDHGNGQVHGGVDGAKRGLVLGAVDDVLAAARKLPAPGVVSGKQSLLPVEPQLAPITQPMPKESAKLQAKGAAHYSDDLPLAQNALFAAWVTARVAAGRVRSIDTCKALEVPGAVRFVGRADVPVPQVPEGSEPLFAEDIQFYGQPVGLMLASSYLAAFRAAQLVRVEYDEPTQPPLLDAAEAVAKGALYDIRPLMPEYAEGTLPGSVRLGKEDVSSDLAACPVRLPTIRWHLPSQAHMYMEPQTAVAECDEDGRVCVTCSTQNLDMALFTTAAALGLPHSKVEIKCRRLGGGFGGKFTHADRVAAAAAVAALASGCQVRLATERDSDLLMFGGRAEVDATFDVGCDAEGRLLALDINAVLHGGAYINFAWFDVEGWAATADSVYAVPAMRAQFAMARLNLPPRTSVRGPGSLTGILAMETIIDAVAAHLGLDPVVVRDRNMRTAPTRGDSSEPWLSSVGKTLGAPQLYTLPRIWKELKEGAGYEARVRDVTAYNASHPWTKRGLCLMPCMYPLPSWFRNATVHIYLDGSVRVVHPGMEMGQGMGIKVMQTAAYELSKVLPESQRPLPLSLIQLADLSTFTLPHNTFTGGSSTSDAACAAVRACCAELVRRLQPFAEQLGEGATWQALIGKLMVMPGMRGLVNLSASAEAALMVHPGGSPVVSHAYTSYGAALTEVELDVLTGDRRVVSVDILMDVGKSINPGVDLGQVEGAFVFGAGFMLHEEVGRNPQTGACNTASTWHYKVPGPMCVPERLNVSLLKGSPCPWEGPLGAKAVGEPPLVLSCSVAFALAAAARAAAQQLYGQAPPAHEVLQLPAVPQHIKSYCGTQPLQQVIDKQLHKSKQVAAA